MKCVKAFGTVAIAAMALMAFVGAGTASATVLCSVQENPCPQANRWAAGTKLKFSLTSSALLKETGVSGETLDTCKESTAEGEITNAGSSTKTVTGPISSLTWGSCTWTTTTIAAGKLEITGPITGTSNGTVVSDAEIKVTISIPFFGSCVYGVPGGTTLGTLTEGKPATFDANAVITRRSGSSITCPSTANLSAGYTLTEPKEQTLAVESATPSSVFCSMQASPCPLSEKWTVETNLNFSAADPLLKSTEGESLLTCMKSTLDWEITNAGGVETRVSGPVKSLKWEESCNFFPTVTIAAGAWEVENIGSHNGIVIVREETRMTTFSVWGGCVYGATTGTTLGTLTEGKPAALDISVVTPKRSGSSLGCPSSIVWATIYTLTEPKEKTLSVEAS